MSMASLGHPIPNHRWLYVIEAPLYGQKLPSGGTDQELESMLAEVERITMTIKSPFGWVTDLSNLLKVTPRQRMLYAESDKQLRSWDKLFCAGTAIICAGAFTRGIVTAVHWIAPPVYPFKIFGNSRDGERWARQQLISRGVTIGPEPTDDPSLSHKDRLGGSANACPRAPCRLE
jgi:hypothetical protein